MNFMNQLLNSRGKSLTMLLLMLILLDGCSPTPNRWEDVSEEGTFLVYRRQSLIGEENYSIRSTKESIVVKSLQGENERGRITGVQAELMLDMDLTPTYYVNRRLANDDTTNILRMEVDGSNISVWEKKFEVVKNHSSINVFPGAQQYSSCYGDDAVPLLF